jgi:hypothetical protein
MASTQQLPMKLNTMLSQPSIDWQGLLDAALVEFDSYFAESATTAPARELVLPVQFWSNMRSLVRNRLEERESTVNECMDLFTTAAIHFHQSRRFRQVFGNVIVHARATVMRKLSQEQLGELLERFNGMPQPELCSAYRALFEIPFDVEKDTERFHMFLRSLFQRFDLQRTPEQPFFRSYLCSMQKIDVCLSEFIECHHLPILIATSPEFFTEVDENGDTFLHTVLTQRIFRGISVWSSLDGDADEYPLLHDYVVKAIVENHPETLRVRNKAGSLPLHRFLVRNGEEDFVEDIRNYGGMHESFIAIFQAYPTALGATSIEYGGRTAFHCLLQRCIDISRDFNSLSRRPSLRLVKALLSTVSFLVTAMPECIYVVDDDGYTPLHFLSTLDSIAELNPIPDYVDGTNVRPDEPTSEAQLLTNLTKMLTTNKSVMMPSKSCKLPLHSFAESKLHLAELVLNGAPKALVFRCPDSKLYPFQLMASSESDDSQKDKIIHGTETHLAKLKRKRRNDPLIISMTFTMLRLAPHLISTTLTAEATQYMEDADYIEGAKLKLEGHRMMLKANTMFVEANRLCVAAMKKNKHTASMEQQDGC